MQDGEQPDTSGLSRRDALRRAAAVGGALVWTVPVVQSMSGVAVAAGGSPVIDTRGGPTPSTSTTTPPSNESKTTSTSTSSSSSSSTVPSPDTSVEGTKSSPTPGPGEKTPDTSVEGTKLPHTGWPAGDFLAVGLGAIAAGAATRSVVKHRHATVEGPGPDASGE